MTADVRPAAKDRPAGSAWLPAFLFRAERWPAYVLKAWLLALIPSIALAALVAVALPQAGAPDFGPAEAPVDKAVLAIGLVLIGPFLETLIMALGLTLFRALAGVTGAVVLSALFWGLLHSFGPMLAGGEAIPVWGLVVWWPFLILSIAYLTWRPRGFGLAIGTATVIHGLQNSVAAAALLLS